MQAYEGDFAQQMLLLHVRPLSAGLQVAVHSGLGLDEEASLACVGRTGTVHALPRTPAGLESSSADLLAVSPGEVDEVDGLESTLTL